MVAEYQPNRVNPQTGKYYYYTTDQINSTRVVTDDEGNVVYSAVHDPYGGVQQTWVNTFNPGWKFSGKEQDAESGLYYFGARYYDPGLYRFLSPDPVIPTDRALYNPQRWNLYGYCGNNPINFVDLDGRILVPVNNIADATIAARYKYLDNRFLSKLSDVFFWLSESGIDIIITSMYRPAAFQAELRKQNPANTAKGISYHQTGWAIDISWANFSEEKFKEFVDYCKSRGFIVIKETRVNSDGTTSVWIHISIDDPKKKSSKAASSAERLFHLYNSAIFNMINSFFELMMSQDPWFGMVTAPYEQYMI
jgi:RHS repeat-associated protein